MLKVISIPVGLFDSVLSKVPVLREEKLKILVINLVSGGMIRGMQYYLPNVDGYSQV